MRSAAGSARARGRPANPSCGVMAKHRKANGDGEASASPSLSSSGHETLDALVASLSDRNVDQLRLQWRNHLGGIAPAHLPGWLLMRLLAYRVQAAAFGDLDRAILRRLRELRDEALEFGEGSSLRTPRADDARGPTPRPLPPASPSRSRAARASRAHSPNSSASPPIRAEPARACFPSAPRGRPRPPPPACSSRSRAPRALPAQRRDCSASPPIRAEPARACFPSAPRDTPRPLPFKRRASSFMTTIGLDRLIRPAGCAPYSTGTRSNHGCAVSSSAPSASRVTSSP